MVPRAALSCNIAQAAVRLPLHALGYVEPWSLTSPPDESHQDRLQGAQPRRYVTVQMAELGLPWQMFRKVLSLIRPVAGAPAV
jgi:hypothetical protein